MGTWIRDDGTEVLTDPETGAVIEDDEYEARWPCTPSGSDAT
ncbi:hypothetical protein ACWEOE_15005 [Amycolatopsis sp. NPDC004368]